RDPAHCAATAGPDHRRGTLSSTSIDRSPVMEWTVHELAERAGISGRTLRHYHRIGLGPYPQQMDTGGGLRRGCQRSDVEGLVGVRGPVSAPGMSSSGVVAGDPTEHLTPARDFVRPDVRVLEEFSFEGGVEGFDETVVGARTDFTHRLGDAEVGAEGS